MQERSSKAAHQRYRLGAIRRVVGTYIIGKSTTGFLRCSKMMTQLN